MAGWGKTLSAIPLPVYIALFIFLVNTVLFLRFLKIRAVSFIIDLAAMTLLVYSTGGADVQVFYLVFLISIMITATARSLRGAFITWVAVSIIYGLITSYHQQAAIQALLSSPFLIRIAFLFVMATFIGYLSEEVETERMEKELIKSELVKKERLAIAGQLASGLAHDFFNILGGLRKLIEFSLQKDSPDQQKQVMEFSMRGLDRAMTIVRNLLIYAKNPPPQLAPVKADKIIEEALDLVKNDLEKAHIKVSREFTPVPEIKADATQLHQVFLNLILNAYQAMAASGGELSLRLRPLNNQIEVVIANTGSAIPQEMMDKIFEPFVSTKGASKSSGIGLGLYVSREIIRAHQGEIKVESEVSKGTRFIIKLPIK
jgi:signal transduction histidine kinase